MNKYTPVLLSLSVCLGVGACHKSTDANSAIGKGQVVASVNGHEITINELNTELSGHALPTGPERKRVEDAALQGLIARTILADIARDIKLDQQPSYLLQQHRANELLLSQTLQREIAARITAPTAAESDVYIGMHPELFAARKIYALDQIKFRMPDDLGKLKDFTPLKSLPEIEQRLIEDRTPYQKAPVSLDVLGTEPELVQSLAALPSGEVFLVPKGDVVYASLITSVKTEPFTGVPAQRYAAQALQAQRIETATVKELETKIKAAQATIKYQAGFGPKANPAK